jgi:N-acetylmuramic acid 6-phosphate etherase
MYCRINNNSFQLSQLIDYIAKIRIYKSIRMKDFIKVTEASSHYNNLEKMSVMDLLTNINIEDQTVPLAVEKVIPKIEKLVEVIVDKILVGGRLFYLGAGTSGRLGILDASEIPPTFGMPYGLINGIIAGGEKAIQHAVENAEDSLLQGWKDLEEYDINDDDIVIGISASGTTPYVIATIQECKKRKIVTASISCNPNSPISTHTDFPIEVIVGPEFVTGSTRMKSGTAQKLVLNMISTAIMIKIGRIEGNKMVNMQLSNEKLIDRGTTMLMEKSGIRNYEKAKELLIKNGSVKKAMETILISKA